MPLGEGGHYKRGGEKGAPPLKTHYFTAMGSSNVKMVADRHRQHKDKRWLISNDKNRLL